jgi:hypothetical protein
MHRTILLTAAVAVASCAGDPAPPAPPDLGPSFTPENSVAQVVWSPRSDQVFYTALAEPDRLGGKRESLKGVRVPMGAQLSPDGSLLAVYGGAIFIQPLQP